MSQFWRASAVTVTNGSAFITVTTGDDVALIRPNALLEVGNNQIVEVKTVNTSNQTIELQFAWNGGSATGQSAIAVNVGAPRIDALIASANSLIDVYEQVVADIAVNPDADSIARRTANGRVKTSNATESNDAVALGQTGTAFDKDVQTSATDATAGRVLTVGAGGLLSNSPAIIESVFDDNVRNGFVRYATSTTGNKPSTTNMSGIRMKFSGDNYGEIVSVNNNGRWFVGNQFGATRFDYREIYHTGNLPDPAQLGQAQTFTGIKTFNATAIDNGTLFSRTTAAGSVVRFGNTLGMLGGIGFDTDGSLMVRNSAIAGTANTFFSVSPNGNARVYGDLQVDGSINESSDQRLKSNATNIIDDELALDAWGEVRAKFFQWNHALEAKGEESARHHAGWMAQEIEQAFLDKGLSFDHYALLAKSPVYEEQDTGETQEVEEVVTDTITEEREEVQVIDGVPTLVTISEEKEVDLVDKVQVVDEEGNPIEGLFHEVPRKRTITKPVTEQVIVDYNYTLRYSQCLIMETQWLRREVERLKSEL